MARLGRSRGNRGELLGEIYSTHPDRANRLKQVVLELKGVRTAFEVERVWMHGGRPVFKFAGIDSISEAEKWEGADVLVAPAERALPESGEFSHADLVGCELRTVSGERVGVVRGVEDYGAAPLLVVDAENGREVMIPFARAICREIDVAAKRITVEMPDGLMES